MAERYDLAIIGAGPGGYVAGIRAGQLGFKVALVEREPVVGGVCLNWGCIPTKALLKNAEVLTFLQDKSGEFGITVPELAASWPVAVQRSRRVVRRMNKGVESLLRKNGVRLLRGSASFRDAHTLMIEPPPEADGPTQLEAEYIVIATGSRARLLPGMAADGQRVLTSRHAVTLEQVPKRMLIMGAGAVGMEFAYIYRAYGAEVTVIEMLDSVLPLEDPEAGAVVERAFRRRGVSVCLGTRVEKVEVSEAGVRLAVHSGDGEEVLEGDQVLVAIGRVPNTEGLNLEAAGVATERGFVMVDQDRRTSAASVYAIGDVAGPPMLAHKASYEGVQVVERLKGLEVHPLEASFIPNCTYCQPQVASVGYTEEGAREAGFEIRVSRFPFAAIGKAVAGADYEGWVKIVADARYGEILGATVVGPEATEIVHELVLARTAELTADQLVAALHAHPTLSEAIHEAALGLTGQPLHI